MRISSVAYRQELTRRRRTYGFSIDPDDTEVSKEGCVFPMVFISLLLHAEFGQNDHREDAPYFRSDQMYLQIFYTKIRV